MPLNEATPQIRGKSSSLIILIHAPTSCPEKMEDIKYAVEEALTDADLLIPYLPLNITSNIDPVDVTLTILEMIDRAEDQRFKRLGQGYAEIIIVGHCVGALLARKVYLFSQGENKDAPFEVPVNRRLWSDKISRIILIASLNRGWSIEQNLFRTKSTFYRFCIALAQIARKGKLWLSCRRGANFITELRIQWLSMLRNNNKIPLTIQLLGTIDDMVTQDDDIDLQTCKDFIYLEVPQSGHKNIIDFNGEIGIMRKKIFLEALTASEESLKIRNEIQIAPEHKPDEQVENVVFVVHGIRDQGFWTTRIARRIQRVAREQNQNYIAITSSYGYFPMWPFLFSYFRRQTNVHWLMDQYTMALAKYPNAKISFVGHSNGTYLLASALKNYPSCQFERVVFAASVIPTSFPWDKMLANGRIKEIRNFVATSDWIVAIFPGVYEQLGISDLGKSGSEGFKSHLPVDQHRWIPGSHNAAIKEHYWQSIAEFIVNGSSSAPVPDLKPEPSRIVRALSFAATACWFILIGAIAGLLGLLLTLWPDSWKAVSYWWLIPSTLYCYFIHSILNRI